MSDSFLRRHMAWLAVARRIYRWLQPLRVHPLAAFTGYVRLFNDWQKYRRLGGQAALADMYPCLFDRVGATPIDPQYFYQAAWAVRNISRNAPQHHVDVGSDVRYVGMLSQVVPVTFVDIRPLQVHLPGLDCQGGTVLALPYPDASVHSLSCLHVVEHVGLGRYGDPLDPLGTEKACRELQRVLAVGGFLYLSAPVGQSRVQFNGQRVQSVEGLLKLFPELTLVEMALVDPDGRFHSSLEVSQAVRFSCQAGYLDYALACFVLTRTSELE